MPTDQEVSIAVLDRALVAAREEGLRLYGLQRALTMSGAVTAFLVAIRGIAAIASPRGEGSPMVAASLGLVLLGAGALIVRGQRLRERMERLARDVQTLEAARDAFNVDARPRVEIHPYETKDGEELPVVVVRTDDLPELFDKRERGAEIPLRSRSAA